MSRIMTNKYTRYDRKEADLKNSGYLDNESGGNLQETWFDPEMGQQGRELHNAYSKAKRS